MICIDFQIDLEQCTYVGQHVVMALHFTFEGVHTVKVFMDPRYVEVDKISHHRFQGLKEILGTGWKVRGVIIGINYDGGLPFEGMVQWFIDEFGEDKE
jgi:hypothetical protein